MLLVFASTKETLDWLVVCRHSILTLTQVSTYFALLPLDFLPSSDDKWLVIYTLIGHWNAKINSVHQSSVGIGLIIELFKLTEWYVSLFLSLPPSLYRRAGHHSTKCAREFPTAEDVEERTDDGVQQEQFARVRYEGHDWTGARLIGRLANKDGQEKTSQRKSE